MKPLFNSQSFPARSQKLRPFTPVMTHDGCRVKSSLGVISITLRSDELKSYRSPNSIANLQLEAACPGILGIVEDSVDESRDDWRE